MRQRSIFVADSPGRPSLRHEVCANIPLTPNFTNETKKRKATALRFFCVKKLIGAHRKRPLAAFRAQRNTTVGHRHAVPICRSKGQPRTPPRGLRRFPCISFAHTRSNSLPQCSFALPPTLNLSSARSSNLMPRQAIVPKTSLCKASSKQTRTTNTKKSKGLRTKHSIRGAPAKGPEPEPPLGRPRSNPQARTRRYGHAPSHLRSLRDSHHSCNRISWHQSHRQRRS